MDTSAKTFRVSGSGETQEVTADKMIVESDGLTFKDAGGNVVGVFRGYDSRPCAASTPPPQSASPAKALRARLFLRLVKQKTPCCGKQEKSNRRRRAATVDPADALGFYSFGKLGPARHGELIAELGDNSQDMRRRQRRPRSASAA